MKNLFLEGMDDRIGPNNFTGPNFGPILFRPVRGPKLIGPVRGP